MAFSTFTQLLSPVCPCMPGGKLSGRFKRRLLCPLLEASLGDVRLKPLTPPFDSERLAAEFRSCVKVEVAVLGFPS